MRTFVIIIMLCVTTASYSQSAIDGWVRDHQTNEALLYCSVSVRGSAKGTLTNGEGNYGKDFLKIHQERDLVFSKFYEWYYTFWSPDKRIRLNRNKSKYSSFIGGSRTGWLNYISGTDHQRYVLLGTTASKVFPVTLKYAESDNTWTNCLWKFDLTRNQMRE